MTNIVIPMAGQGSRFSEAGYTVPKPLISVNGKTLAERSIESLGISGKFIFITRSFDNPEHNEQLTSIFAKLCTDFIEVRVDDKHLGAAHSALFAEHYLNYDEDLIITNCDQQLYWNADEFMSLVRQDGVDGGIVLYPSTHPKHSFAVLQDNVVVAVAEKQPISSNALVGIHYWKNPQDFINSARLLVNDFKLMSYPECYVSVTYDYLIRENKKIVGHTISDQEFWPLGTPGDIERYIIEYR